MNKENWSPWYVRHLSGNFTRLKIKPSPNAVHGGSGSVSMMIIAKGNWQCEFDKIDKIAVIRFHPSFVKDNEFALRQAITLEEFKEMKLKELNKNQMSLEDF